MSSIFSAAATRVRCTRMDRMSLARMLHRVVVPGLGRSRGPRRCDIRARLVVCAARVYTAPVMLLQTPDPSYLRQRRGKKWRAYAPDVLPAWVADMDFPPAEPIREVLQNALDSTDLGYPSDGAARALAELFSERCLERYSWRVDPARVEVLGDVIQALYIALEVFSEEHEFSTILTPIYPPFLTAVRECKRPMRLHTLDNGPNGYEKTRPVGLCGLHSSSILLCVSSPSLNRSMSIS